MTTLAMKSEGVTIGIGQGDGATTAPGADTFDLTGEITSFDGPSGSAEIIDATHFDSTFKEKIMGLPDEGSFTMGVNWVPSNVGQAALRTARAARTLKNIQVTLTDTGGTVLDFKAYVMSINPTGSVDAKIDATITLEITGEVTET